MMELHEYISHVIILLHLKLLSIGHNQLSWRMVDLANLHISSLSIKLGCLGANLFQYKIALQNFLPTYLKLL